MFILQNSYVPNIALVNILNDICHLVILLGKSKLQIAKMPLESSIWHFRVQLYNIPSNM